MLKARASYDRMLFPTLLFWIIDRSNSLFINLFLPPKSTQSKKKKKNYFIRRRHFPFTPHSLCYSNDRAVIYNNNNNNTVWLEIILRIHRLYYNFGEGRMLYVIWTVVAVVQYSLPNHQYKINNKDKWIRNRMEYMSRETSSQIRVAQMFSIPVAYFRFPYVEYNLEDRAVFLN